MCDSPGFTKPTHGYGQPFGCPPAPDDEDWNSPEDAVYDEPDWAGPGFETPAGPE